MDDLEVFCAEGNVEQIKMLLGTGKYNIQRNVYGDCPDYIVAAVAGGKMENVKYLHSVMKLKGKHVNHLVLLSSQNGELEILKYVVEVMGGDVRNPDVWRHAETEDHEDVIKYLIFWVNPKNYSSILLSALQPVRLHLKVISQDSEGSQPQL